jgi:hypothetical protein
MEKANVGDVVWYVVGADTDRQQARITAISGSTHATIRLLTGPQSGQEFEAPWGVIQPFPKISNVGETQSGAELGLCLQCKKTVAITASLGTLEVKNGDGTLIGHLHPLCKVPWEKANADALPLSKANVDEDGHDLAWHKEHCRNCIELAPGHWQWCEKALPLFVKEPL